MLKVISKYLITILLTTTLHKQIYQSYLNLKKIVKSKKSRLQKLSNIGHINMIITSNILSRSSNKPISVCLDSPKLTKHTSNTRPVLFRYLGKYELLLFRFLYCEQKPPDLQKKYRR